MPKKFPTPELIPLDMSLSVKGKLHDSHPDINCEDTYMCLYDGRYYCGKFYNRGGTAFEFNLGYYYMPFRVPGDRISYWQQIWKMVGPEPTKVKLPLDQCLVKNCTGCLKTLKTCVGDPEGIRHDRQCKKCNTMFGCSKSSMWRLDEDERLQVEYELKYGSD